MLQPRAASYNTRLAEAVNMAAMSRGVFKEWLHHRKLDNPKQNLLINIAGHEQYGWPFYSNYRPDNFERWDTALRHVTEHGYKPIWIDDGFFGGCS